MDRREFLAKAGLVTTWAGIAVCVSACGDDGDGGTGPNDSGTDVLGSVTGGGHGHAGAVVTETQIAAGSALTLTLTGSGHTHTADLSASQVMEIGAGTQVSVSSTNDGGHVHTVTFN